MSESGVDPKKLLVVLVLVYLVSPIDLMPGSLLDDALVAFAAAVVGKRMNPNGGEVR
jgi:uncharacterized membrane protein YkvA (DUF1232 family)